MVCKDVRNWLVRILQIQPKAAPFYPLPPGLGKRAAMLF
jgi:hypothetical protein